MDLLFTREGVDPQTAACAKLLTAIITQAILDASEPVAEDEQAALANLKTHPREAIAFLFDPESLFAGMARVVGLSAESIRRVLLDRDIAPARPHPHSAGNGFINLGALFPPERRAALRMRLANSDY